MFWMETPTPDIKVAQKFGVAMQKYCPNKFNAYNLSPSFNWDAQGMTDDQIQTFSKDLAQAGYQWQFITLAGFHMMAMTSEIVARDF